MKKIQQEVEDKGADLGTRKRKEAAVLQEMYALT